MVDSALVAAALRLAPDLVSFAKEVGLDLSKAKRDDLLFLVLVDHHRQTLQILENQSKILNDIHSVLVKVSEDTAVLRRRGEVQG